MNAKLTEIELRSLRTALDGDFRQLPVAYPVLADHGYMERTANGYKAIDPAAIAARIKELLKDAQG